MKSGKWFLLIALLLAAGFCPAATNFVAKLDPVPPFPSVCTAANDAGIPLSGLDLPAPDDQLLPGDSETGLITLHEANHRLTQWLISFEATTNLPAPSDKPRRPMVLYTSTGDRYEFLPSPVGIRVRILGPFPEPDPRRRRSAPPGDEHGQVFVNQNFLHLGLDAGAAAIHRWGQAAQAAGTTNFVESFDARERPFNSTRTNHDAALAARWHVTAKEERAVVCWDPALDAYFNIVGETPNLEHILLKVISLPSIWSVIKNVGVKVDFGFDNKHVGPLAQNNWGLPGGPPVYSLPMLLAINKHPSLATTMLVTSPHPPLLVCGGVLGFVAENPDVAENYLTLRIIGAHCHK